MEQNQTTPAKKIESVLRRQTDWKSLWFYQKTVVLYRMTYAFTRRFLPAFGDRTVDQMVQAARSGKQNIVEGSADGVTSMEMELKLLNVARSSIQELLEDYEDYLPTHHQTKWSDGHPRYNQMLSYCREHNYASDYEPFFEKWTDEEIANIAITLCHMVDKMMMTYQKKKEEEFVTEGGIRERMTRFIQSPIVCLGALKTRRHMTTYTQFWDIDGNIRLPRPERTYFDDGADEFKDITFEEKLLEIAYCVWHGLSLYDEVKTTLQEHTSVNESTIKRCLLMYIEYLRSGDFKNISYVILNKKLNGKTGIKQAAALLSDELMLRYRLPANGEPHYLSTAHWNYKELEGKVDYSKPTTVSNIPLSEQEILDINPWQSSYVNPNRAALYDPDAEWLLVEDEKMIKDFNEKADREYRFELGMRPEPFNGNPLRSKVVILSLNPGYKYRVNNLVARLLQMIQPIEEAVKLHKDLQLKLSVSSFFCKRNHHKAGGALSYRDAHCMLDDWYWYDIFEEFRKNAELEPENDTNDIIFNHTALVQYVGYISKSWKSLPNILPSQRYTKLLIQYLALNSDTLFVISRSESEWKELIGDEIWDMLEGENRLVHRKKYDVTNKNGKQYKTTIRTQAFTKESFEDGGFDRIAKKLKND